MYSRLPEKRCPQKPTRPSTFRVDDETDPEATPQYFQISVNVIEARKLAWINPHSANSYVLVVLGKKKHRTSIRRNMEDPWYRERIEFELYMSITDVQRSSIWLAVMEPRCCATTRMLGETNIDLGTVWKQPHHQVFQKWAQLSLTRDPAAGAVGFLKVDVSIIFRGEMQMMPLIVNADKVEDNLLLPSGSEQQQANYQITIYGAFSLPSSSNVQADCRYGKPPSTFVRVTYSGLTAKTAIQHRNSNPAYCEQISIVEMFPNISEKILLEVFSGEGCFNKVLASTELRLADVSHDGDNGFLPTFGPSLLHMYSTLVCGTLGAAGEGGPYHRGALLVTLKTIVPYYQQDVRSTNVKPVVPVCLDNLWQLEDFCIFCPILEVSMLDRRIAGKLCGVAITIGDMPGDNNGDEDFMAMMEEIKSKKLHYTGSQEVVKTKPAYGYIEFPNAFPILQLATRLPDFRFRMYRNNMMHGILTNMEHAIEDIESRLKNLDYVSPNELKDDLNKALDDAAANIIKFLDIIQYSNPNLSSCEDLMRRYGTELDQKQLALQREEIGKIYQQIMKITKYGSTMNLIQSFSRATKDSFTGSRKEVKILLAETKIIAQKLRRHMYKNSEGWPDIVIWLLNGGSRVAFSKISAADVIYSVIPEQNGRNCGRIQTIYMKPLKCSKHVNTWAKDCFCIAGKIELFAWMGLHRQMYAFDTFLPIGYKLKFKEQADMCLKTSAMMLECRAFVYRAKLNNQFDISTFAYSFVRINVLNLVKETEVKQKTLTPIWNQVLKIHKMCFSTQDRLMRTPPMALVEVFECDLSGKTDLIGRFQVQPELDNRQSYEYAPKLQWYDVYKGVEHSGKVLMSVQLLQVPETFMKSTVYNTSEEFESGVKDLDVEEENLESLPAALIPCYTTYKVDVYWWGLRDVIISRKPCVMLELDDLTIKSDIIGDMKANCNFPNGRASQVFEAPLSEEYCPPLSIILYDSNSFGRTLFLGTNVMKNPNKFLVSWLPKTVREASLRSVSITPSDFFQVNKILYVRKSQSLTESMNNNTSNRSSIVKKKIKRSKWRRLFYKKEPEEEEYYLIPMFVKEKDQIKVVKKVPKVVHKDWWSRYFASQECKIDDYYGVGKIAIYDSELEYQTEFCKFKDWCGTIKLYCGMKTGIPNKDEQLYCGFLKAGIAIYRWPPPVDIVAVTPSGVELSRGYYDELPSNDSTKFLIRVYIVKGVDLMVKDYTGKSDPYVIISCGNKHCGDRNNYVSNSVDPIFASLHEIRCKLPEDYQLTVSVYDYNAVLPDELIGSTIIDLEDRIYSRHRARVGLSSEYNTTGSAKWRDILKPSLILEDLCLKNHLPPPIFPDASTVVVNGVEYKDTNGIKKSYTSVLERKENICLSILHKWQTLPICGHHLVPEHIEARTLWNPDRPGVDQGKLQMWVDIFPLDAGLYIPSPIDITPRKLEEYELRVIVWDVQIVQLLVDCTSSNGKKETDIYVKVWIGSIDQAQYTDVHYRSVTGDSSFNWRMIFHFQYQHAEKKVLLRETGPFTKIEESLLPILVVQVVDSDAVSQDDCLASLALNLNNMPPGVKHAHQCTLDDLERCRRVDLFSVRSIRAWWPLNTRDQSTDCAIFAGVLDMELTLLPKEKAILMPVGMGREPPSPLPKPK